MEIKPPKINPIYKIPIFSKGEYRQIIKDKAIKLEMTSDLKKRLKTQSKRYKISNNQLIFEILFNYIYN